MADYTWGAAKSSGSGNAAKIGLSVSVSVSGSTATATWTAGFWSRWTCDDAGNSWAWSGATSGGGSNHNFTSSTDVDISWDVRNQRLAWASKSVAYDLTTQGGTTKTATLTLQNIDVAGGQALTVSSSVTLPYLAPAACSSGTASDPTLSGGAWSSALSWTLTSTSPAPVQQVKVYRWDSSRADASYLLVATLGAVTSYLDTGLAADRRYGWAVQAVNTGGSSAWHYFGDECTAPASPTSHAAARSGSGIAGSFVSQSTINPAFEVWDSTDGGTTWVKVLDIAAATRAKGSTVSYTLSGTNQAVPHLLRVKAVLGGQSSGWATISAPVIIITKPNAPVPSPSGGAVTPVDGSVTLTATPDSTVLPDGSAVTAYNLRHRLAGAAWTETGKTTASSLSCTLSYASAKNVEHQWQVWGAHADPSDWSAVASFRTSTPPTATITAPAAGTITSNRLTITTAGVDPDGDTITAVRYGLEDAAGAALVATVERTTGLTGYDFPVDLADGQTVVAWVQYQDAYGLWGARAQATYTVDYLGPAAAVVTASWADSEPAVVLAISNPPTAGLPATVSQDVYLIGPDGTRTLIAEDLEPYSTIAYRRAPLVETTYEVVTVSALPSTTSTLVTVPASNVGFVVSGGPGYSLHAVAAWDVGWDRAQGRERVTSGDYVGYAYPDEIVLESLSDVRDISTRMTEAVHADFERVQSSPEPLWYRDPTGASWPCSMTPPRRGFAKRVWPQQVSFTVTRIGVGPLLSDPQSAGVAPVAMESAAAETATTDYVALVT